MFTRTVTSNVNIRAFGDCELTVVAVGGGGRGDGGYGGGGSGYVASTSIKIHNSQLVVKVGGPGETSSLQTSEGEIIITAAPGEDSQANSGGAGYSGIGGGAATNNYSGDGGEDGGDGHDSSNGYNGGAGSGLNISSISLEQFTLTPGAGGVRGGGGGVLVNMDGPQDTDQSGQGYGGGGSIPHGDPGDGLVLLEIKMKEGE